ncbi:polynucleotide kinase [Histoplasma capsulatum]|uniref:Polynucleotide kinase n=1 Tax=Ajellomyces capsulatus TaxID=5037 RepID=A0A8A1MGD1_AJECA|nr:polynucleotide kinase [Histoplasma capsulatum]
MAPLSLFRYLRMVRFSLFHTKDQLNTYTLFNSTVRLIMNGTKRKSPDGGDISPPPLKRKAIGTATNKTVANFFTPVSQKKPEQVTWRTVNNSCIIGKYHQEQALEAVKSGKKRRIAAFDLDSTLVATKSGRRFPTNERDWKWWSPSVPDKLKQLNDEGFLRVIRYLVVVLSNQKAISLKKDLKGGRVESKSLSIFKQKVAAIMQTLDMPFSVYAATASDEFRKPRMGMWREMLDDHDLSVAGLLHLEQSIFVGDAAGREGDHSCVDRDFAANVGVPFETPEEFFLDEAPKPILRTFDPKAYIVDSSADEHNTNAGPETRAYWIDLAKETNVPIRCIYLSTPPQICKHNDAVRAANPMINLCPMYRNR